MHRPGHATGVASPVPSRSTARTLEVGGGAPEELLPRSRRLPLRLRGAYKRFVLLLARVSIGPRIPTMEPPPPHKLNIDPDEDRISALPDDLLLGILERLDLREAVRAGAVSRKWRHLPHRLSRLHLDVRHFDGATPVEAMDAFTGAMCRLLSARPPPAECKCAIKTLVLCFFPVSDLSSIARAVEDVVNRGETECLEFHMCSPYGSCPSHNTDRLHAEMGQQFISFSRAYPVAFGWLTMLTLEYLAFGHSDVTDLISACGRLRHLTLSFCRLVDPHSTLKINAPHSRIQELKFIGCFTFTRIELISVPKLRKVWCQSWCSENPPLRFGYVPELRCVFLISRAIASQAPFTLSECLSSSAMNLSNLCLDFGGQMIWIQPEHPKQLTATFGNLTDMGLFSIFPECDLSWTLFILEAAPALQNFRLSRDRNSCVGTFEDDAEKTNVVWEPSKDLKHLNLKLLLMSGFEEEDKVTNYIRLVMERAVGLKRIELHGVDPCKKCDAIDPSRSHVDEARRRRIKERLTHGSSSSVEIIMC